MSNTNDKFSPCPICNKEDIGFLLHTKDYSLTKESFQIIQCSYCSLKYTDPVPNKDDIAPYYNFPDYISHTDNNQGIINKLYHKVRNRTLTQKTNWVQSLFTGYKGRLLEVGAGTGAFANAMTNKGWKVTALEPDVASRERALNIYQIQLDPIEDLYTLHESIFDVITLWHVLEHVHDLNDYLRTFYKLLKPNGRLIIAVPNYTSYDAQFYKKYWAAYDVPRHLYHFSPTSMEFLSKKYKMQIASIHPMWYDSFYVSLLSERYKKSGVLGMIRAVIIGCLSNIIALRNNRRASSIVYEIKKLETHPF
jgi:2-polyprenyl-3-methyl-5-hydroxy-6-metoxy-1,4-benzoquinol methylase